MKAERVRTGGRYAARERGLNDATSDFAPSNEAPKREVLSPTARLIEFLDAWSLSRIAAFEGVTVEQFVERHG